MNLIGITSVGPLKEALMAWLDPEVGQRMYRAIIERVGDEPGQCLGHGGYGTAYALKGDDTKVLKVTGDMSEVLVMSDLPIHPNIVRVYDSFLVKIPQIKPWTEGFKDAGVGVLIKDRVQSVLGGNDDVSMYLKKIISESKYAAHPVLEMGVGAPNAETQRLAMEKFIEELYEWEKTNLVSGWDHEILMGVIDGLEALHKAGIYTIDAHLNNLGIAHDKVHGERVVFFDIGAASTEDADLMARLPVLENPPARIPRVIPR